MPTACRYTRGRVVDIDIDEGSEAIAGRYCLMLVRELGCVLEINHQVTEVAPGLICLRPGSGARIIPGKAQITTLRFGLSFLNVNLHDEMLFNGEYQSNIALFGDLPLDVFCREEACCALAFDQTTLAWLGEQMDCVARAITEQADGWWSCRARLYTTLILDRCAQTSRAKPAVADNNWDAQLVAEALRLIDRDFTTPISLTTLAKSLYINKNTLTRLFAQQVGMPVTQYIIQYRLRCARTALATTSLPLPEIAAACGFSSEAYLIRQFRQHVGMTPGAYRKHVVAERMGCF